MEDKVLGLLGLMRRAGAIAIGLDNTADAVRAGKARLILLAADAGPSSARRAASFAESGACLLLTIPADKDRLGRALGRTSVAMAAVTDIGFAEAVVQKLAVVDERYRSAAEHLAVKAKRAQERRQEQVRHEKNLHRGKKRGAGRGIK